MSIYVLAEWVRGFLRQMTLLSVKVSISLVEHGLGKYTEISQERKGYQ